MSGYNESEIELETKRRNRKILLTVIGLILVGAGVWVAIYGMPVPIAKFLHVS